MEHENGAPILKLLASYAYRERKDIANRFKLGEGLVGQCAFEKERILLTEVPNDYIQISSGLGEATPLNIVVLPVLFEGEVKAVIELASFHRFNDIHMNLLDQLTETIGIVLEHDRRQHANGRAADAVADASRGVATAAGEAPGNQHPPGATSHHAAGLGRSAQETAGRAEADQ